MHVSVCLCVCLEERHLLFNFYSRAGRVLDFGIALSRPNKCNDLLVLSKLHTSSGGTSICSTAVRAHVGNLAARVHAA